MRFAERQALDFAPDVRPLLAPSDRGLFVDTYPNGVALDQTRIFQSEAAAGETPWL